MTAPSRCRRSTWPTILPRLVVDQDQLRREARMRDPVCPPQRMRYSLESRCRIVQLILAGSSPQAAAAACGASRATGYRLWRRYQQGGWAALVDRPSVPRRQPRRLPRELELRILAAREYAKAGPLIVAGQLGLPASTVWKVLHRYGVSRLRLPAREPVRRYERSRPASCCTSTSRSSAVSDTRLPGLPATTVYSERGAVRPPREHIGRPRESDSHPRCGCHPSALSRSHVVDHRRLRGLRRTMICPSPLSLSEGSTTSTPRAKEHP